MTRFRQILWGVLLVAFFAGLSIALTLLIMRHMTEPR